MNNYFLRSNNEARIMLTRYQMIECFEIPQDMQMIMDHLDKALTLLHMGIK